MFWANLKVWAMNGAVAFVCYFWVHSNALGGVGWTMGIGVSTETVPTSNLALLSQGGGAKAERYQSASLNTWHVGLLLRTEWVQGGGFFETADGDVAPADAPVDRNARVYENGYGQYEYTGFSRASSGGEVALITPRSKRRLRLRFRMHGGQATGSIAPTYSKPRRPREERG